MDREAWWGTAHRVTESDMAETLSIHDSVGLRDVRELRVAKRTHVEPEDGARAAESSAQTDMETDRSCIPTALCEPQILPYQTPFDFSVTQTPKLSFSVKSV